jgi:ABC-type branched-subunit amino acid transport system substrate-binding protein
MSVARAEILIGAASPLTGEQAQQVVEMAAADLNARGGVLGHTGPQPSTH